MVCLSRWDGHHLRRGQRRVFKCFAKIPTNGSGARNDGCLANDFWNGAVASGRMDRRWQSRAFSLDGNGNLLPALPCDRGLVPHLFTPLLADAANVGHEITNHFADHSAGGNRDWLGAWWGTLISLVAPRWLPGSCRR